MSGGAPEALEVLDPSVMMASPLSPSMRAISGEKAILGRSRGSTASDTLGRGDDTMASSHRINRNYLGAFMRGTRMVVHKGRELLTQLGQSHCLNVIKLIKACSRGSFSVPARDEASPLGITRAFGITAGMLYLTSKETS